MRPNKIQEAQQCSSSEYGWEKTNYLQSSDYSLYFKANDDKLNFNNKANLGNANDNYSSGLLFLAVLNVKRNPNFSWGF
jgi:hypothetical protein